MSVLYVVALSRGSAETQWILLLFFYFSEDQIFFTFSEDQNFPHLIKFCGFCHSLVAALPTVFLNLESVSRYRIKSIFS